jgi:N-carbamoylputrescine amidase
MSATTSSKFDIANEAIVAVVQATCCSDTDANVQAACAAIDQAAAHGAQLVCLQELFNTLYLCQEENHEQFQFAEPIPGPSTAALCHAAKKNRVVVVAGLFEKRAAGVYHNSAVVIERDGTVVGTYRKMHIPDDPHYYEKFYFAPGDLGFRAFDTSAGRIGVCICWDQWFPEAARLTALQGAQILVYPTAIGWLAEDKKDFGESQLSAWRTMMRSHAIANGVFVAAPNRVGVEDNIEFWGHSFICDPYGNLIANASADKGEMIMAPCEFTTIEKARTHWPFLRDRRIDAYGDLTRRLIDD